MTDGNDNREDENGAEEISEEDLKAGRDFLKRFSHIIFGEGIVHRTSHEERARLAEEFAHAPNLDIEEVEEILRYSAWFDRERERAGEDPLLQQYARIFLSAVVRDRSIKEKNGIAIFTSFEGRVISCIGYALNEGITELATYRLLGKMATKEDSKLPADLRDMILSADTRQLEDGAYFLAVKAAEHIEAVLGEKILMRAYAGDFNDFETLAQEFDRHFGEGNFLRVLSLSDDGRWREVFKILKGERRGQEVIDNGK